MRSSDSQDFISSSRYSVEELRQAIRGGSSRLAPQLALALLARKQYPEKLDDLRRVLTDANLDTRLRAVAAQELGRLGTKEAKEALAQMSELYEPEITQAVARASTFIDRPRFIPEPQFLQEAYTTREPAVKRFIGRRPLEIKVERLPEGQWQRLTQAAVEAGLGEEWSIRQATQFTCVGRRFGLVLHRRVERGAAFENLELAGIVARQETVESGEWKVRYAVFAQRMAAEELRIALIVVEEGGQIAYRGVATGLESGYRFEIGTSVEYRKESVEIAGFFQDGQLRFDRAATEAQSLRGGRPKRRKG